MNKKYRSFKLLFVLIFILVSSAGVTLSLLRDTEISSNNSVQMGTVNLQVGDTDPTTFHFNFNNISPREIRQAYADIKSIGSISGNFWMQIMPGLSFENENPESETEITEPGDLPDCLEVKAVMSNKQDTEVELFPFTPIGSIATQKIDLPSGSTVDGWVETGVAQLNFQVRADNCGSEVMGDSLLLDMHFHLDQV